MSITIKDIADKAKVSTATVSRALNKDQTGIKPEVREQIVQLAQKMGYKKKDRKGDKRGNNYVGVIYKREPSSFTTDGVLGDRLYHAIELALYKEEKQLLMHNMAFNDSVPPFLKDGLVSSVLLVELDIDDNHHLLTELNEQKIPAVALSHPGPLVDFDVVSIDYIQCFETLTKRLLDQGCQNIVFVSDDFGHYVTRTSYLGYTLALLEAGKSPEEAMWIKEPNADDIGRQAAKVIADDGSIDGVICMDNIIAANIIDELTKLAKSVPGDIKLCGFDPICVQSSSNQVTSGNYDLNKLSTMAIKRLQYRTENPAAAPVKTLCRCDIISGETG